MRPVRCLSAVLLLLLALHLAQLSTAELTQEEKEEELILEQYAVQPEVYFADNNTHIAVGGRVIDSCKCSATSRGHPSPDVPEARNLTFAICVLNATSRSDLMYATKTRNVEYAAEALERVYGTEALVNFDIYLRPRMPLAFCRYDRSTGNSIAGVEYQEGKFWFVLKPCDKVPSLASSPEQRKNFVKGTPSGPDPDHGGALRGPGGVIVKATNECPPITPKVPRKFQQKPPDVRKMKLWESPVRLNEGCIAVEHIDTFAPLQHGSHLRRAVLCKDGFCATPNHAIIVRGVWTSMRTLCEREWTCSSEVRLVNNLRVSRTTRVRVSADIVVTPYDARFPIAAVWVVQAVQEAAEFVAFALQVAVLAALVVVAHACSCSAAMPGVSISGKQPMLHERGQLACCTVGRSCYSESQYLTVRRADKPTKHLRDCAVS